MMHFIQVYICGVVGIFSFAAGGLGQDKDVIGDPVGTTWEPVGKINSPGHFECIDFVDENNGWVLGTGGIFRTQDGGENWKEQTLPTTARLLDLECINPNQGWIVGFDDTLLHTADGGKTWSQKMHRSERGDGVFFCVFFIDETTGWIAGNKNRIFYTKDGGETWQKSKHTSPWSITSIHFLNEKEG